MDTKEKRDYVKTYYRQMVRDGFMTMDDPEIVSLVDSLNAAELAHEVKECREVDAICKPARVRGTRV